MPMLCCKFQVDCYKGGDNSGQLLWNIKKCCCNCHTLFGMTCYCICPAARKMKFEMKDGSGSDKGKLKKVWNGWYNEWCTAADKYKFKFPSESDDEKAIFLAAVQFIDMLYFENPWGDQV